MKKIIALLLLAGLTQTVLAQNVAINTDGSAAHTSAALDIKSTDKGMLVPRMTSAQRTAISNAATGLLVFDTDSGSFWFYNGTAWTELSGGTGGSWNVNGNNISNSNSGNVGIGTSTPATSALLHMQSTSKAFLPPSMNTEEMNTITSPQRGMIVYNNELRQPHIYTQYRITAIPVIQPQNRWEPIMTGPRLLAWGYVDSSSTANANIINGSGNFNISWNGYGTTNDHNWYQLGLSGSNFDKDSMLLMVTPVGNGSWDQAVSIGELVNGPTTMATIKFADITRMISGTYSQVEIRRRSQFYFTLYDMRKQPF